MTVDQLLAKLAAAFPAFNAKALEALASVYRVKLGRHEGPALAHAYVEVVGEFTVKASKALFPMPADFERHLPTTRLDLGQDDVQKLDFAGRKGRADGLFWSWRAGQGTRAAKGNRDIMRALENIARPLADLRGWEEHPEPLLLTREQLKTACQCAISLERRLRYGTIPYDRRVWWAQIKSVADSWSLADITPEWWDSETARYMAIAAQQTAEERAA